MDKTLVFDALFTELESSLVVAVNAANDARELATHEQSKPETQYDTVGLEASYLAHGQSQRVNDLQLAIEDWQQLQKKTFDQSALISAGALVELIDEQNTYYYLLGHFSGGLKLKVMGKQVMVITTQSPIGEQLSEKQIDDEITLPNQPNHYLEITYIG